MANNPDNTDQLLERLQALLEKQQAFSKEIEDLRTEIYRLKRAENQPPAASGYGSAPLSGQILEQGGPGISGQKDKDPLQREKQAPIQPGGSAASQPGQQIPMQPGRQDTGLQPAPTPSLTRAAAPPGSKMPAIRSDLEKFIGENLINKIGIVITVIGVAIGAKYAIDHELISPLTRIILGYMVGGALLGFAIKLKAKYENFSAVLLSGSMAILYFITYSAYDFYGLIPQLLAFTLMVIFTAFTVAAAIAYNRQVIAHIGMVGAYAVPFLLSDGSGKVAVLFSYIAIINLGILVISLKKYWKSLYYLSLGFTWLIYALWWMFKYDPAVHFTLAAVFLTSFFFIFYLAFLGYKLTREEKFGIGDIILLLVNSFVFFGIGYSILDEHETGRHLLGLFTLCNAIIHFLVSLVIYRRKLADRNLFYLISGLVLVFITIAIPVQLDGNWVTLLWAGEAAFLFWIGRAKHITAYEKLSYPLMLLAFISIIHDWTSVYNGYYIGSPNQEMLPLLNVNFLSSLLFITAFGFINIVNQRKSDQAPFAPKKTLFRIFSFLIPAILLIAIYYAFRLEIEAYWDRLYAASAITIPRNQQSADYHTDYDLISFKIIWVISYSLLFVSALAFANLLKIKSRQLGLISLFLTMLAVLVFLGQGLYTLSELRESYLEQDSAQYYRRGVFHIGIRYISFAFVALALIACYRCVLEYMQTGRSLFILLLHVCILWILSSELINWLDISGSAQSYKLGLSILWGTYSLFLIILGIWKKRKDLRIGAIVLFTITLVKLFFYDISHLDTIARTITFVLLGVLLLIISFLYNKYKHIISDESDK